MNRRIAVCLVALAACGPVASASDGSVDARIALESGADAPPVDVVMPALDADAPETLREDTGALEAALLDTRIASDAPTATGSVAERARALAMHLRGRSTFLVGMGNDLDGAPTYDPNRAGVYTLGAPLDLHYMYLVGYGGMGGWPDWNEGAAFPRIHADAAARNGAVAPMFTYYQLALEYENGVAALQDAARMRMWLRDVRTLFQRLGAFDRPALLHFEPDLFGYLQQRMTMERSAPDRYAMRLRHGDFTDCNALPEVASSLGPCLALLRDRFAPKVRIALHASQFGDWYDALDPSADIEGKARSHAAFLRAMGADHTDFIVVETLDRDAGFWETNGGMRGTCSLREGPRGAVYWDESNRALPNFAQHFRWVRALTNALSRPALWWQTPFGVAADTCGGPSGGSDGHYRDNRVRYFFSHVDELVAAGGFGMCFGTGADRQTYITTDGGQFRAAVMRYSASPTSLP